MQHSVTPHQPSFTGLSFLWLELTNRCNLECVHCYSDSSPRSGDKDTLTKADYLRALDEGVSAGCHQVQFIGGEPTLNPDLCELINYAAEAGYTYIEVYSNLIRLPSELVQTAQQTKTRFATSVYASDAAVHDVVTGRSGSHARTISNLKRLIKLGIPVRGSFIETEANAGHWERTEAFLHDIEVDDVGYDVVRGFGRGAASPGQCDAGELCGRCWDERLCVAPDGSVSPCIMSKAWGLGNIRDASLKQIAFSSDTEETRSWLHANRGERDALAAACAPELSKKKRICAPRKDQTSCAPELSKKRKTCGPVAKERMPGEGTGPCLPRCGPDISPSGTPKELPQDKPGS